jgi:hypothetical protein
MLKTRTVERKHAEDRLDRVGRCVKKALRHTPTLCRVVDASAGRSSYKVLLEREAQSEQFLLPEREMSRFVVTGNEAYLVRETRNALGRLDKRLRRRSVTH